MTAPSCSRRHEAVCAAEQICALVRKLSHHPGVTVRQQKVVHLRDRAGGHA